MTSRFIFNKEINHTGQCMILGHIIRSLKSEDNVEFNIDQNSLAEELGSLNVRMTRTVMEIIMDYNHSNPEIFKIMGKEHGAPYGGFYENISNNTTFDLIRFPDSLIVILYRFIELNNTHKN